MQQPGVFLVEHAATGEEPAILDGLGLRGQEVEDAHPPAVLLPTRVVVVVNASEFPQAVLDLLGPEPRFLQSKHPGREEVPRRQLDNDERADRDNQQRRHHNEQATSDVGMPHDNQRQNQDRYGQESPAQGFGDPAIVAGFLGCDGHRLWLADRIEQGRPRARGMLLVGFVLERVDLHAQCEK